MSNLTDFFPAAGGGGGGVLNEQTFITSGSFDPAAAGLDVGDKIIVEAVAGGGGGSRNASNAYPVLKGPDGGQWKAQTFVLTATTSITIVIGSGGINGTNIGSNGGATTVAGSGVSVNCTGGTGGKSLQNYDETLNASVGPHWGGYSGGDPASTAYIGYSAGPGVNGYGVGGAVYNDQRSGTNAGGTFGSVNTNYGCGGLTGPQGAGAAIGAGTQGVVKIYY